jgi:hypothetical protein
MFGQNSQELGIELAAVLDSSPSVTFVNGQLASSRRLVLALFQSTSSGEPVYELMRIVVRRHSRRWKSAWEMSSEEPPTV